MSQLYDRDQITRVRHALHTLITRWETRYRFVVEFKEQRRKVMVFTTYWCRRPTPTRPFPEPRIEVEFAYKFSSKDKELKNPKISYIFEPNAGGWQTHSKLENIDYRIQSLLKFKTQFNQQNHLSLSQPGLLDSRLLYNKDSAPAQIGSPPNSLQSVPAVQNKVQPTQEDLEMEQRMIAMFSAADADGSGTLDQAEFRKLLLSSGNQFSEDDITTVMMLSDHNHDGLLNYKEFIPVAVGLVQATKARKAAESVLDSKKATARGKAISRVRGCIDELTLSISTWEKVDTSGSGLLTGRVVARLLHDLPVKLDAEEVELVILGMERDKEMVSYQEFCTSFEKQLVAAIESHEMEKGCSDMELYLRHEFSLRDHQKSGFLTVAEVQEVLTNNEHVPLTDIQRHVLLSGMDKDSPVSYSEVAQMTASFMARLMSTATKSQEKKVLHRSTITPIALLAGRTMFKVQAQMKGKFREFDGNDDGFLEVSEFAELVADTGLSLSKSELTAMYKAADLDGDGKISIEEFMGFSGTLLQLARDAVLKSQFEVAR